METRRQRQQATGGEYRTERHRITQRIPLATLLLLLLLLLLSPTTCTAAPPSLPCSDPTRGYSNAAAGGWCDVFPLVSDAAPPPLGRAVASSSRRGAEALERATHQPADRQQGAGAGIEVRNVFRSFMPTAARTAAEKVRLSGRVITLTSDAGRHFSVLPPAPGCGSGAGAPVDVTARGYAKHRHHVVRLPCDPSSPSATCRAAGWAGSSTAGTLSSSSFFMPSSAGAASTAATQRLWVTSSVHGCRVATNGGLYNTTDWTCHGSIVSDGAALPSRHRRIPYFGVTPGRAAVVGYLDSADVAAGFTSGQGGSAAAAPTACGGSTACAAAVAAVAAAAGCPLSPPADGDGEPAPAAAQLVGGLVWLVRDGQAYVSTGVPQNYEDGSVQESGTLGRFVAVASGRTLVGVSAESRLVIAQIDGRSDWAGLDLHSLASWATDDLGLVAAINLDGGASTTFVRDGGIANVPSYNCHMPGGTYDAYGAATSSGSGGGGGGAASSPAPSPLPSGAPVPDDPNFRCKRPVGSILCLHDDPPPPALNATTGRLLVTHGCVCFPLRTTGSSSRAAMTGDPRFSVDDVLALVQLGMPTPQPTTPRRRAAGVPPHTVLSFAAVQAAAGGPGNAYRRLGGSGSSSGGDPMCLCTPSAAAAAVSATAPGARDTPFERDAGGSRGAAPLFELYTLARQPPSRERWRGTVDVAYSVDDLLDWVPPSPGANGGSGKPSDAGGAASGNASQPCTDVAALAHAVPLCVVGAATGGGMGAALRNPSSLASPSGIVVLTLITATLVWLARATVRRRDGSSVLPPRAHRRVSLGGEDAGMLPPTPPPPSPPAVSPQLVDAGIQPLPSLLLPPVQTVDAPPRAPASP